MIFFFSPPYQLPFLIPWGLPRFLGKLPFWAGAKYFSSWCKNRRVLSLIWLPWRQPDTRKAAQFGHKISLTGVFSRVPNSLEVAKQPAYWKPVCETAVVSEKWQFVGWPSNGHLHCKCHSPKLVLRCWYHELLEIGPFELGITFEQVQETLRKKRDLLLQLMLCK